MARPGEKYEFESWHRALSQNKLDSEQEAVLQKMVDDGQADNLEAAAQLLDWQDAIIDPDEHMYGF